MKILQILTLCLAGVGFAACSSDDEIGGTNREFKVVSEITPSSRAPQLDASGAGHFESGDVNTLFFHDGKEKTFLTFPYTNGHLYYWSDLGLSKDLTHCQLSACYPAVSTTTPQNLAWNVVEQSQPDLLVAAPADVEVNTASPIRLNFSHVLHQLSVELLSGEADITEEMLQGASVTLRHFLPVAHVNLLNGTNLSADGNLEELHAQGKRAVFIVPGQNVNQMEVVFNVNGHQSVLRLSDCRPGGVALQHLESGKKFILRVRVHREGFTIVSQDVAGWGSQGVYEGNVIM